MIKGLGLFGIGSLAPVGGATASQSTTMLGSFEAGTDGWKTNGGNDLVRVSDEKRPAAVTEGEYALAATSRSDPYPMIENESRVQNADFLERPYLLLDLFAGEFVSSDDPVTFRLRYHYGGGSTPGGPTRTEQRRQQKSVNVVESDPIVIPQGSLGLATWDLSQFSEEKRSAPSRLELVWHLGDEAPVAGPRGRGQGDGLDGTVFLDNARLTADVSRLSARQYAREIQRLVAEHGTFEYVNESVTRQTESGVLRFDSGTEVDAAFTMNDSDAPDYVVTLGDRQFEFRGDAS